jgi:hypothetical protein
MKRSILRRIDALRLSLLRANKGSENMARLTPALIFITSILTSPIAGNSFAWCDETLCDAMPSAKFEQELQLGECQYDYDCPSWGFKANYTHFWQERTGGDFVLFSELHYEGTNPLFYFSQVNLSSPGFDGSIFRSNGRGQGVEMRYLGASNFSDVQSIEGENFSFPGSTTAFGGSIDVGYSSELQSLELLRYLEHEELKFSCGFRLVSLKELLSYRYTGPQYYPTSRDYLFHKADNTLYGFQIGLDRPLWRKNSRFSIDGLAKSGIYLNDLEVVSQQDRRRAQNSDCRAAFVGEVGLTAVYTLRDGLFLRLGYQMVYIDGVCLAADQSVKTSNLGASGPAIASIDQNSLFYHGLNAGVEYRF